MISSRKYNRNILLAIFQDQRTVFRLKDIAMLTGETNHTSLNKKINYYVRTHRLYNPRKGLYVKPDYSKEELACKLFTPSYISMEYVLQKAGIIFQYDPTITSVSYLSRSVKVEGQKYTYHKLKEKIMIDTSGIIRQMNHINIATPERAMLDMLYLNPHAYFDNLNTIKVNKLSELLPIYQSKTLTSRVKSFFQNV